MNQTDVTFPSSPTHSAYKEGGYNIITSRSEGDIDVLDYDFNSSDYFDDIKDISNAESYGAIEENNIHDTDKRIEYQITSNNNHQSCRQDNQPQ